MKQALSIKQVAGKMTWLEVMRHYRPDITEEEAEYILWNETCYPFDLRTALKQIYYFFKNGEVGKR